MSIRALSRAHLKRPLRMPEAMEVVKEAYLQLSMGQAAAALGPVVGIRSRGSRWIKTCSPCFSPL